MKNYKQKLFISTAILMSCSSSIYAEKQPEKHTGIINFTDCISNSKYGKQEQKSFENIRNQMSSVVEDIEKQLSEIANKMQDSDFMDSLSPEAEQEMKIKFQGLNEELNRYQNQYMQVLQQANMKLVSTMKDYVSIASESIAKKKRINMVITEDACFYYSDDLNITDETIQEMDKNFEASNKPEDIKSN